MFHWVKELLGFDGDQDGRFYVYELIDPRFDPPRVFYVGSGTADRMYQHAKDTRRMLKSRYGKQHMNCKHKRIVEIWDDGAEVQYGVVFRTNQRWEAYEVESERIEHFGLEKLTNETYGYTSAGVRRERKREKSRVA